MSHNMPRLVIKAAIEEAQGTIGTCKGMIATEKDAEKLLNLLEYKADAEAAVRNMREVLAADG